MQVLGTGTQRARLLKADTVDTPDTVRLDSHSPYKLNSHVVLNLKANGGAPGIMLWQQWK